MSDCATGPTNFDSTAADLLTFSIMYPTKRIKKVIRTNLQRNPIIGLRPLKNMSIYALFDLNSHISLSIKSTQNDMGSLK